MGLLDIINILGILFIGLKLIGKIDWSWWWVTAPFWVQFVGGFLLGLMLGYIG